MAVKRIHGLLLEAAKGQGDLEAMLGDFQSECGLLERVDHPHIVGFKGAFYDETTDEPVATCNGADEGQPATVPGAEQRSTESPEAIGDLYFNCARSPLSPHAHSSNCAQRPHRQEHLVSC